MSLTGSPRAIVAALVALASIGCGGAPQKPNFMATVASEEISVTELRAADYEFASRFTQLVAQCANSIANATDDHEIRDRALLWRLYASPQARLAAFNQDPLAGLLELWALAGQQRAFFVEGDGKDEFGDHEACVLETSNQLEQEAEALAAKKMPPENFERVKVVVMKWVAAHPIEGRLFVRPTAQADLAAWVHATGPSGLKAVSSMEETFRDLNDRISILSVQMPLEARWQAEYLIHSLFEDRLKAPAETLVGSMNDISAFLENFENALGGQTTRIVDAFSAEREAVFAAIEEERQAILEAVDQERTAIVGSINTQVDDALARVETTGRDLIDHFFQRLIGVLVAIGIFIFIIIAMLIGALRTRSPTRSQFPSEAPKDDEN